MPSPHLETPRGTAETLNRQRKPVTGRRLRQTAGVSHILSVPDKAGKAKSCSGPDSPSCCTQLANDPLHTIHLANNPLMPHTPSKWEPARYIHHGTSDFQGKKLLPATSSLFFLLHF